MYNSSVSCPFDPIPFLVVVFIISGTGQPPFESIFWVTTKSREGNERNIERIEMLINLYLKELSEIFNDYHAIIVVLQDCSNIMDEQNEKHLTVGGSKEKLFAEKDILGLAHQFRKSHLKLMAGLEKIANR